MRLSLPGLVAAPFTPFRADGELAPEVIARQARTLAANGVIGAFVCGTTGEGPSLTTAERRSVAAAWVAARPPGLKVIVHVGHTSAGEARALAGHAQEIGADAIATVAPNFLKPPGQAELVAWCAQVAAGAPQLPFFYYHIPVMTGVTLPAAPYLAQARQEIPTLAGLKFTHEDLADFRAARELSGDELQALFGRDEMLLAGLQAGATGAIGSTYNYAAPLYIRLLQAWAAGDLATAEREQARARAFIDVMIRHGGLPAGKAIMKLIGLDCGPARLPLRALGATQEAALRADLAAIGFFEYASQVAA